MIDIVFNFITYPSWNYDLPLNK